MTHLQTLDPSGRIGLMTPRNSSHTNSSKTEKARTLNHERGSDKRLKADSRCERLTKT